MTGSVATLVVHARGQTCALPLETVIETLRPLPIAALSGQPAFVLGVSVVRGRPTPVLDLGALIHAAAEAPVTRFVTVRAGARRFALAVAAVQGIRTLPIEDGVGMLDGLMLTVVHPGRLVSEQVWHTLAVRA